MNSKWINLKSRNHDYWYLESKNEGGIWEYNSQEKAVKSLDFALHP
ncbi:hypothetical protein HMPREF9630_00837 [Peptoanaerobacter stomatis]|uniref:Uncharacterized protein n=1 Tax=Peptoanaerobacter stomatis TaxID=796937 RepID=V9HU78_9FIRM|nr:hypothetical protein HMPREF9630_00837 [Peptoanaerobacter stomatis]